MWLILRKLRRAMVAPERGSLTVEVEVDECWIGGVDGESRGEGRVRSGLVPVGVGLVPVGGGLVPVGVVSSGRGC